MTFSEERGHGVSEWNWAGTHEFQAAKIIEPATVAELQEVVAGAGRVRPLGTRHSFSAIADGPGVLVTSSRIPVAIDVASDRRSVTVGSGGRYAEVATALEAEGLALHNMGSLPHISVGGATATGTHGSGLANGSLSTSVSALEFVGPDGELRRLRRGDDDFDGSVVHLGALGPVTRVTLDVEPSFRLRQDVYQGLPWSALDGDGLREVMGMAYSVSLFTHYDDDLSIWMKTRVPDGDDAVDVPDDIRGAQRDVRKAELVGRDDNTTPMDGTVGPWHERLPHFRIDRTPSNGEEIQTEYFVALADGVAALAAVKGLRTRIQPHLLVTELRVVAGDPFWLSETQGRDSLCIHFTWAKHPAEVAGLLPVIEDALRPFAPRPHWGKVFGVTPREIEERYPRLADFRALVERHDPAGKFGGAYLDERVLGAGDDGLWRTNSR